MNQAEWFQPTAQPLTKEQEVEAYKSQVVFPKIVRKKEDPPIPKQNSVLVSFLELPQPINGVHAFVKVRGCYKNDKAAEDAAQKLVREVDSKYQINIAPVGTWFPIKLGKYEADIVDVRIDEEDENEKHLNDQSFKDAEKKGEKIKKEIRERTKKLLDKDEDPYSNLEGIDYFVQRKVSGMAMDNMIEEMYSKLEDLKQKRDENNKTIDILSKKNPDYPNKWVDVYNKARKDVGLPPFKGTSE